MKKLLAVALSIVMSISLVACGSSAPSTGESGDGASAPASQSGEIKYEVTYTDVYTYAFSEGDYYADIVFAVKNTGDTPFELTAADCDLEDAGGNLISLVEFITGYPGLVNPGQTAYFHTSEDLPEGSETLELVAKPKVNPEKAESGIVTLNTSDVEIASDKYFGMNALGRVENTSDKDVEFVEVGVVLFNKEDKPFYILTDIISDPIKAGDKASFEASSLIIDEKLNTEDVSRFETFAYSNF